MIAETSAAGAATGGAGTTAAAPAVVAGAAAAPAAAADFAAAPAVEVKALNFDYGASSGYKPVLKDVSFSLPRGARMLLIGDNGAGKSSLLRVIAGRHIHREDAVKVFGKHAFYDNTLNSERSFLAGDWGRKTVAFTGHCALQADIAVRDMMVDLQTTYKERREMLVELLGVDLDWRMHQLSDGQRRRVQLMLQLLRPSKLLLLDEITTDLDLITRQDFLSYMRHESEVNGVTIIYATHIFDGLDDWATHFGYVADNTLVKFGEVESFDDFKAHRESKIVAPLLRTVEGWLRADRDRRRAKGLKVTEEAELVAKDGELRGATGNGYLPGRFNQGFN